MCFIHDRTKDGWPLKWLSVVEAYTRKCLAPEARRSFKGVEMIDVLRELLIRGMPLHIRGDNGPEFVAKAIRSWLKSARVRMLYIEPGRRVGERLRRELSRAAAG